MKLNNLDRGKTYRIKIYADNGVTNIGEDNIALHDTIVVVTQSIGRSLAQQLNVPTGCVRLASQTATL